MKKGLLLLLLVALGTYGSFAQDAEKSKLKELVFVLDGKLISKTEANEISPSDILTISILKDSAATELYGSIAKNGVALVTTIKGAVAMYHKKLSSISEEYAKKIESIQDENDILYVINGKGLYENQVETLYKIRDNQIKYVKLLDAAATKETFGVDRKEGAVVITLI